MLSDTACRKAKPADKPFKLGDAAGLYLYVLPTGYRSWRWKYRVAGKEKRMVFGSYPEITLAQAREMREDAARQLRGGVDPSIDKQQRAAAHTARVGATFQTIADDWMKSQAATWSKGHAQTVKASLERDVFGKIGHLPIDTITTPMVLSVLRPIEERGAIETAHRIRQRISEIYARAIGSGIVATDPAAIAQKALAPIRRGKQPAVRTVEAARNVLRKVEEQPAHPLTKLASRLLALTAVRSGVLRMAEPGEFEGLDGAEPLWRIRYYSRRTVEQGVSQSVVKYCFNGAELDPDGNPYVATNVGATIDEALCGFDHLEQVNWSAAKNAKLLMHGILAVDHRQSPDEMMTVGVRWAEETLGRFDLPYLVTLHAPPPDGDQRNWHLHVLWSYRPLVRTGDHEWHVGEMLRSDLDNPAAMKLFREMFAAVMTDVSFEAGQNQVWTARSNADCGLPHEPQVHLGAARTNQARSGEHVAKNEENHERVMRSRAAVIDDALRHADEALIKAHDAARAVAARFARLPSDAGRFSGLPGQEIGR